MASESNSQYLVTADQANILIIWDLTYFEMLKSVSLPSQLDSDNKREVVFSMKFVPTKKDLMFVAMESGDVHEVNISEGELKATYFLNLGPQPSFSFDDGSFFLISLNANLSVEFYKKDLMNSMQGKIENQNTGLELPPKARTHLNLKSLTQKIQSKRENELNPGNTFGFLMQKRERNNEFSLFDIRQSSETNSKKPILCLKLMESPNLRNFEWGLIRTSHYYSKAKTNPGFVVTYKNVFFSQKIMSFITVMNDSSIVYWKKTVNILTVFSL